MRRVLVLNHFAAPIDAPGGTRHVELFSRLPGWEALVIASDRNYLTRRTLRHNETTYRTVWSSPYWDSAASRVVNWTSFAATSFVAGLWWGRVDVVYASSPHLLAGLTGWGLARIRRARFVLEVRDLWPRVLVEMGQLQERSLLYRTLCRLADSLYRRADVVVVMAKGVEACLADDGVDPSRLRFIPNGADPEDFTPAEGRDALRRQFGLDGVVVVYAGAHGPANGLDAVLDAARELRSELPDVRFLLVGDGVAKKELVTRARDEGLDNVEFRPPVPKTQMRKLLAAADVGLHVLADVSLFRFGVSPNKLFDYMAAGLPVITNTGGEVAALVEEAGAGLAVAPGGIADGVRTIVGAGPDGMAAWGRAARAFVARHHSRSSLAEQLANLLDELVSAEAAARSR